MLEGFRYSFKFNKGFLIKDMDVDTYWEPEEPTQGTLLPLAISGCWEDIIVNVTEHGFGRFMYKQHIKFKDDGTARLNRDDYE